jgi:hypothetical protein
MEDEVLNLEFGIVALESEEQGALFRVVNNICNVLFGDQKLSRGFKDSIETIEVDGSIAKITRVIIRNVGCVIGSVVEIDYFQPSEEMVNFQIHSIEDDDEDNETCSITGKHINMSFDMCDGSFYKNESLAKLMIDEAGGYEIDDLSLFDIVDNDGEEKTDEFSEYIREETLTLTIEDYFVVNTVKLMLSR